MVKILLQVDMVVAAVAAILVVGVTVVAGASPGRSSIVALFGYLTLATAPCDDQLKHQFKVSVSQNNCIENFPDSLSSQKAVLHHMSTAQPDLV